MGKIHRNDPCPCGSGKKYKYCCALKTKNETLLGEQQFIFMGVDIKRTLTREDAVFLLYALDINPIYSDRKILCLGQEYYYKLLKLGAAEILQLRQCSDVDIDKLIKKGIANGKIIKNVCQTPPLSKYHTPQSAVGLLSLENVSEVSSEELEKQIEALGLKVGKPAFIYECNKEKTQVEYIKNRLNEDMAFFSFLIREIFENQMRVDCNALDIEYRNEDNFWEQISDFVNKDEASVEARWEVINELRDYSNMVLAPYDPKMVIETANTDLMKEFVSGKVTLFQTAVFHEYIIRYLCKRFSDYRFLPSNILRYDNSLTIMYHRGFDFLLAISINLELQMGVHLVFQRAGLDLPYQCGVNNDWFKKTQIEFNENDFFRLPPGTKILMESYLSAIDKILKTYNPYFEFNSVFVDNARYKEELESLAEIVYMNLPQGNGTFLDYSNSLRAMCIGLLCGNKNRRERLFKKSLQFCTQMDYLKMIIGIEKVEQIFSTAKNTNFKRDDFIKIYHETVFYFFDEKNGINFGTYPIELEYVDADTYDALKKEKGYYRKNPSFRERFYYDYRHLRVEIFEMLSGTFLPLKDDNNSIKGLYPVIPFFAENNHRILLQDVNKGISDGILNMYESNTNHLLIPERRQEYLGFVKEIDEIPVSSLREFLTSPVFYTWLKQKETIEVIREKNIELSEKNDKLKRYDKLKSDMVSNLSHSASNYINSEKLVQIGVELDSAVPGSPTIQKLRDNGLLLLLQSENETYLQRRLESLVIRCGADETAFRKTIIKSTERDKGKTIREPLEYAVKTIIFRILMRDGDIRSDCIKEKYSKQKEEWNKLRTSFITDVLASKNSVIQWSNENLCTIEYSLSAEWTKLRIVEDSPFYDLIIEILTEQLLNSFSHGDLRNPINIDFGQTDEIKRKKRLIPKWCYISCSNSIGKPFKGGRKVGLETLDITLALINEYGKGLVTSADESTFTACAWLKADLLGII